MMTEINLASQAFVPWCGRSASCHLCTIRCSAPDDSHFKVHFVLTLFSGSLRSLVKSVGLCYILHVDICHPWTGNLGKTEGSVISWTSGHGPFPDGLSSIEVTVVTQNIKLSSKSPHVFEKSGTVDLSAAHEFA